LSIQRKKHKAYVSIIPVVVSTQRIKHKAYVSIIPVVGHEFAIPGFEGSRPLIFLALE
jgi:hypothetical protein